MLIFALVSLPFSPDRGRCTQLVEAPDARVDDAYLNVLRTAGSKLAMPVRARDVDADQRSLAGSLKPFIGLLSAGGSQRTPRAHRSNARTKTGTA